MDCAHEKTRIVKQIATNGAEQVFIQCLECGENVTSEKIGKSNHPFLIKPSNAADLPIVADFREQSQPCAVCGAMGTEVHHWAPRYIFNDDADKWPTAQLCPRCHALWHNRVTPTMSESRRQ